MCCRDSNPAQYERNRRFGHLVHALGREAGGAKLPSAGLCLNASKAVSLLDGATIKYVSPVGRKALKQCDLERRLARDRGRRRKPSLAERGFTSGRRREHSPSAVRRPDRSTVGGLVRCRDSESSVDDLCLIGLGSSNPPRRIRLVG